MSGELREWSHLTALDINAGTDVALSSGATPSVRAGRTALADMRGAALRRSPFVPTETLSPRRRSTPHTFTGGSLPRDTFHARVPLVPSGSKRSNVQGETPDP